MQHSRIVGFSTRHPRLIIAVTAAVTVVVLMGAAVPSLWPDRFPWLHGFMVDTDPENMLSHDEPVRVFHSMKKREMALYDMVVVGVVNNHHPQGVFNPSSLQNIYTLTEFAKRLRWPDPGNPGQTVGVIEPDILSLSTVDNIRQSGPGTVAFEWLMRRVPETDAEAAALRDSALRLPMLNGTVVSEDGKAVCIYLPLTSKDVSYTVREKLLKKIAGLPGDDEFHITGLPVAEDTFGVEMFVQMAVSAPAAMLIIFIVMLIFFRKLVLIVAPLILAMVATICTMGLLIASGNTIHIMSSMIPIFIMPIAVLDSIHILSEFFDIYQRHKQRQNAIIAVMDDLFLPMLYTSLTTAVGFASLALAPIPPVQVFGLFVALGVMLAWLATITFVPAYVMMIPEHSLKSFGKPSGDTRRPKAGFLVSLGGLASSRPKAVLGIVAVAFAWSAYGVSKISINDNPVKWFNRSHPIRVADRVLNQHFGGTYMAYLSVEGDGASVSMQQWGEGVQQRLAEDFGALPGAAVDVADRMLLQIQREAKAAREPDAALAKLSVYVQRMVDTAPPEEYEAWDEALVFLDRERQRFETFKRPDVLQYVAGLQKFVSKTGVAGKSSSLADIVKTVYRELVSGRDRDYRIPATPAAVAQCLMTYQNSHRPNDLWHFVTPDYKKAVIWLQLKRGDNRDMSLIVQELQRYVAAKPPPVQLAFRWFGLTYINVIWQQKMVRGMLESFLGSFLIVFLMMTLLYRSALWGMLSMVPLTVTIVAIYGLTGFIGKDYDMPIAVLSSLSLGLAVDYAIHFLSRARALVRECGSWQSSVAPLFGEPARAISRNVAVLGVGFLPLLAAPLMPYKTVGFFIASILFVAGVATLFILPAMISLLKRALFPSTGTMALTCKCGTCIVAAVAFVALLLTNLARFQDLGWSDLMLLSGGGIIVLAALCFVASRRQSCRMDHPV